jgi:hypothetical protein
LLKQSRWTVRRVDPAPVVTDILPGVTLTAVIVASTR